jgi:hypothetical protein
VHSNKGHFSVYPSAIDKISQKKRYVVYFYSVAIEGTTTVIILEYERIFNRGKVFTAGPVNLIGN